MARPNKIGLDYFPFDIDFFEDEKITAISGEFGIKGEITVIKLLCAIYRNGYFILWNDLLKYKLLKSLPGISSELIESIVNRLVLWEFFNKTLFDSARILTSRGIQERYFEAIKRRRITEKLPYLLINVNTNGVNVYNNPAASDINVCINSQSKENESKENNNTPIPPKGGDLGEYENSSKNDLERDTPNNPPAGEKEKKSCGKRKEKGNGFPAFAQRFVDSIPDPEWRDLFTRWLKYKKDRGDSYKSEDSLKTALEKLKKMSGSDISVATEIVENSIANNWQGLFPLKNIYNNGINRNSEIYEVYAPVSDFSGTKSTL